ncbi:uncharacterized protein LOC121796767 [Salvia splendens]|uniref:uncharacterized protein LOC121796767 n=1 Tax=Salvia splendens TaxID=180675 RepID=UPI001C27DDBC|nr:uncharacterized protein LOC121796767 [Salvia splendens]
MGCDENLKQLCQLELEEDVVEGEIGKISECGEATEGEGSECGEATEEGNIGDESMEDDNPLISINDIIGLTTKIKSVMVDVAEMCDAMCTATTFTTDVLLLPVGNCDMVLRVQWPETLGDIQWNFKNLTTDFMLEGTRYELGRGQKEQRISTVSENELLTQCNGALANQQSTSSLSTDKTEISVVNEELNGLATTWDVSRLVTELTETFTHLSERLSGFLSESQSKIMSANFFDQVSDLLEGSFIYYCFSEVRNNLLSLLERRQKSGVASQIRDLSQNLVDIIDEAQRSVSPPLFDLSERLRTTLQDLKNQLDLIVQYDWDFNHDLEEDVSAAMEYIRAQSKPKDGRILAIGHSMGGILLYAMLARYSSEGRDPGLAAVVTLASSLDYTSSKSSLKLLIPLADPAQALNVPVVPLGALLSAAYPLTSSPPYVLSWTNDLISAQDMMHPELLKKLVIEFGNRMNGGIEQALHKIEEPKHRTERVFRVFKGMFQPSVVGNIQIPNLEDKVI